MIGHVRILMVAGEVSGDRQASYLARAIRAQDPDAYLYGAGGDDMQQAGVDVRLKTIELGSVGMLEVLPHLRSLRRAFLTVRDLVRAERPDAAVLVDNETFSMALAAVLKDMKIPVVYYFPPQVSLWGKWRTRKVVQAAGLLLSPFRGEMEPYEKAGARIEYLGHPLLDIVKPERDSGQAFELAGLDPERPTLALMPGSRSAELRRLLPRMLAAVQLVKGREPRLQVVLPVAATHCRKEIDRQLARAGMGGEVTVVTADPYAILSRCAAVLMKAGTCTLEAALLGVPMAVVYRMNLVSCWAAHLVAHTRFISMPNILLGREVTPEFFQGDVTAAKMAGAVLRILEDPACVEAMRCGYQQVRAALAPSGALARAAELILREAGQEPSR